MKLALALAAAAAALAVAGPAAAAGGTFTIDGGNARQQANVRAALQASSFDWSLLPTVTIHIARGTDSFATPGQVWLDGDLLDSGKYAWGTVQHEVAHQIDFFLLDSSRRAAIQALLGGGDWCYELSGLAHDAHGCERFADTVAAAYWSSPGNTARAWAAPAKFRALLNGMLGPERSLASFRR